MKSPKKPASADKNENIRHSLAHLLAAAVRALYPGAKNAIGPAIENGFYQDFELHKPISQDDLPKIEAKMRELLPMWTKWTKKGGTLKDVKKEFSWNRYKMELPKEFARDKKILTFYTCGGLIDLFKGGHAFALSEIDPESFKLDRVAGAYWRGDEKNKMLTRIYGLAFENKKELERYLWQQEEAKKRDHRKLGKELDLFSFHEEAPGFVFWHPKGMLLREALMSVHNKLHKDAGYQTVSTPILLSEELWRRSGHWDNYKDKIYFTKIDKRTFAIKPMNCPGTILLYKEHPRSWRNFPLRLAEAGEVHRHEPSGTLHGLFRVRAFRQDDAHIFVREEQVEEEIKNVVALTLKFYELIGFKEVEVELSTRPEKYIGSLAVWTKAESTLAKVLKDLNVKFKLNRGDGAFYGPKIDFHIKDSASRLWQCGTIQLDFFMPKRFELEYTDKDGLKKRPIMIHRTVIGSIQRFTGIIIEHFKGAFPFWLAPVQTAVLTINEKVADYAEKVFEELKKKDIRAELDLRNESISKKIREAELQKIPYLLIIGEKEAAAGKVAVRERGNGDTGQKTLEEFFALTKRQ